MHKYKNDKNYAKLFKILLHYSNIYKDMSDEIRKGLNIFYLKGEY